jgi:hypothetical protein
MASLTFQIIFFAALAALLLGLPAYSLALAYIW